MNEWTRKRVDESFRQYKERYFRNVSQLARVIGRNEYDQLYKPVFEHWGIHSPARGRNSQNPEIIICDNVPDKDYIGFLFSHEAWEDYIANKSGFNLSRDETMDKRQPIGQRKRSAHRFATYKEFLEAKSKGKLEEYYRWWEGFYVNDIWAIRQLPNRQIKEIGKNYIQNGNENPRECIINFIKSNWNLKRQIYEKVRQSDLTHLHPSVSSS